MAGWSGFTDEDLRKLKQSARSDQSSSPGSSSRKVVTGRSQPQVTRERISRPPPTGKNLVDSASRQPIGAENFNRQNSGGANNTVRVEAVQHDPKAPSVKGHQFSQEENTVNVADYSKNAAESERVSETPNHEQGSSSPPYKSSSKYIKELDHNEALSVELNNMQMFQQRQKVIEEANKRKRQLLSKAIDDRRKMAKAEAEKLMKVQQELNHLDSLLTADVSIIRDRIEVASLEYMDAQKRYEKVEKEFIAAKMDLYSKGESKEQLTEHLYTIIHQNEVRKAKKLVELMEKLAMEVTPEEMELTVPAIPPLTNFTAVSTLHDPFLGKQALHLESVPDVNSNTVSNVELVSVQQGPEVSDKQVSSASVELVANVYATSPLSSSVNNESDNQAVQTSVCPSLQENTSVENQPVNENSNGNQENLKNASLATTPIASTKDSTTVEPMTNYQPKEDLIRHLLPASSDLVEKVNEIVNRPVNDELETSLESPIPPVSNAQHLHEVDIKNLPVSDIPPVNISSGKGWTLPFA